MSDAPGRRANAPADAAATWCEMESVNLRFGARGPLALDGVSLHLPHGAVLAIVGTSGSGKSTLLRVLLGLERPQSGRVRIDGAPLPDDGAGLALLRHRIGYVIQAGGLFPHLSVRDNLALLPTHLRWPRARIDARIAELLEQVRLPASALARRPTALSGGERQRVALMRALMTDPPALLLDEPLGAVDPVTRHALQDQLRTMFAALGKTVIVVTHDLAEAAYLAPELAVMHGGRLLQRGSYAALRDAPADDFVARFLAARRALPEITA